MVRVRICEDCQQWYWNSGTGITINKDNREGIEVNPQDFAVKQALTSGIIEIVTDEKLKKIKEELTQEEKTKILTDVPDTKNTMKEVVSDDNNKQMEKVKEELKEEEKEVIENDRSEEDIF